jgi:pyrophosphatase PpaX
MKKINCILFDLDGTLIDTNRLIIESFQHTVRVHQGREATEDEFVPYFGEPLVGMLERLAPGQSSELIKTYREFNVGKHDELTTQFPGTAEVLQELKDKGITLGVVTSKMKPLAKRGLQLFNLEQFFKTIVSMEDTTAHKPNPEPLLKALEILGRGPEGVLYVGDATVDIKCAHNAGVQSAAVMWSALGRQPLLAELPNYALESMADLLKIV